VHAGWQRASTRSAAIGPPGPAHCQTVAASTFGGRIERMGRWRRGTRQVSLAELRELLRSDQDELAAALQRRSPAHRATRRRAARQRYLIWLQRQLQTDVPPTVTTPEELNALIADWKLRRNGLVKSHNRANVTAVR
jgi:hypothetical protein